MREREIFIEALEQPSTAEAMAYVDRACEGDAALRKRIERLLSEHWKQETFILDGPPPRPSGNPDAPVAGRMTESPGSQIGQYKLLEQIGEGGMGTVWVAEQSHPIRRRVALKVIKLGMDTQQVIARFDAERQALALMDHINIARVLDAGANEQGRPYFVMELVQGVPINKYCDDNHLTPRQRLELFIPVCQAIQHAHQKGIIHRDIKPSNVLVTVYEGKPVPKIIDFGIAKATEQRLTERTLFTQCGMVVGTLEYMSPEQAEMSAQGVDTRSDIYSLGVLLYELLTGTTPLGHNRLKGAAYDEILRIIREEEPPKLSTRLSDPAHALASISALRQTEPAKLAKFVRGELDWIVMKTLEKDRNRRYETANGLAMDLQRYLADEPVQACPPSATYRFRKFARRNKAALLTVITLVAALVGGTTVSTFQAIRATRATREKEDALNLAKANEQAAQVSAKAADAERVRAEAAFYKSRRAVSDVVVNAAMGIGKWSGMPIPYRKIIAADALKYFEGLIQTNSTEPAVRYETGLALGQIGLMHWRFGEHEQAVTLCRRSVDVLDALVRDVPGPPEYRQQRAYRHLVLGWALESLKKPREAEKEYRSGMSAYEEMVRETPGRLSISNELCDCYKRLIWLIAPAPEAQTLYQKLVVCADAACQPFLTPNRLATRPADQAHREAGALGEIAFYLVGLPASVRREPATVIRVSRAVTELDPSFDDGWRLLALGHSLAGDYNAAEAAFSKTTELFEKKFTATPTLPVLSESLGRYSSFMHFLTRNREPELRLAELTYREALRLESRVPAGLRANAEIRRQIGQLHRDWASALCTAGRFEEAQKILIEAQDVFDKLVIDQPERPSNWHYAADTRVRIATIVTSDDRLKKAEELERRAVEIYEARDAKFQNFSAGSNERERVECYCGLAELLANSPLPSQRDPAHAVKLALKAVKMEPGEGASWTVLGMAHYRSGHWKDGLEALNKSVDLHTVEEIGSNDVFLAMTHWQMGDKAEALRCYDRAAPLLEKNASTHPYLKGLRAEAMELLGVK